MVLALAAACTAASARPAHAQWYLASFTGGNHTLTTSVTIDQPAVHRTLIFHDVHFRAEPMQSRQYYGGRLGRRLAGGRFAVEFEFLHMKAIAETGRVVRVTGRQDGAPVEFTEPMDVVVQHYAMTHGLNYLLGNVVWRVPLDWTMGGAPVVVAARAGAGPIIPGVNTRVDREEVIDYEYGGVGAQAAAGIEFRIWRMFEGMAEYKLTWSRPRIDVAHGAGVMTAVTHHVAAGLMLVFPR